MPPLAGRSRPLLPPFPAPLVPVELSRTAPKPELIPKHSSKYRSYSARRSLPCGPLLTPINYVLVLSFGRDEIVVSEYFKERRSSRGAYRADLFSKIFPYVRVDQRSRLNGTIFAIVNVTRKSSRNGEKKAPSTRLLRGVKRSTSLRAGNSCRHWH